MASEVSADAIVVYRSDSGESDRRLTLVTDEFGKIDVLARGARKAGSRLAGSSEPMVRAVFHWVVGRNRRFVTQVQPMTSFPTVRSDYGRTLAGVGLIELFRTALPYESPHEGLFSLLADSLAHLEKAEAASPTMVWALAKFLEAEGVHPSWLTCTVTGQQVSENPAYVSPLTGGYVCSEVARTRSDSRLVAVEALIALDKVVDLDTPPSNVVHGNECLGLLHEFLCNTLESRLPALSAWLSQINSQ